MNRESPFVFVGTVVKPHGLQGALFIFSDSFEESSLAYVPSIYLVKSVSDLLSSPDKHRYQIVERAVLNRGWKLLLKELSSVEEAEPFRQFKVYIDRSNLKPASAGEYYISDLKGLEVFFENERLGKVVEIETAGTAHFNLILSPQPLSVPFVKAWIENVDLRTRVIRLKQRP